MRYTGLLLLIFLAPPAVLRAQDTASDPVRVEHLRQLIEDRFADRLREELGLTEDQTSKVRVVLGGLAARRRGMERDERRMRQALAAQLRPGIAANPDSVGRLVDALTNHRVAYAQTYRDEMRELATILNPVQRGQYLVLRERLMQRVQEMQQQARQPNQPGPFRPNRRP